MAINLLNCKSSQANEFIKIILKSGLLLEEDMDYVLIYYTEDDDNYSDNRISTFEKLVHGLSFGTILYLTYKKFNKYIPLAISPVLMIGIWRTRAFLHQKRQNRDIGVLVESIQLTIRLNRLLIDYYKERDYSSETSKITNSFTQITKDLLTLAFKEELDMFKKYLNFIKEFGRYVSLLHKNFEYLEHLDLSQYNINNIDNIEDSIKLLKDLSEIYILITSNALTCLCVAITPEVALHFDVNVVEILDRLVPRMKIVSKNCYDIIYKKFNDVKYFYLYKTEIKSINKPLPKHSRLYLDTEATLSKSSDVVGKSQSILEILGQKKFNSNDEKQTLHDCIVNLRNQVRDFLQSLDILVNLYEIEINRPKTVKTITKPSLKLVTNSSSDQHFIDASLNSVEPSSDEEYELYIGANDTFTEHSNVTDYDEEEGLKNASFIYCELKQKLKKHARFIAARQKLGFVEDDQPIEEPQREEQSQPPQLSQSQPDQERSCVESESSEEKRKSQSLPTSPRREQPSRIPRRSRIPRSLPLSPRQARGSPFLADEAQAGPSGSAAGSANADAVAGPSNNDPNAPQDDVPPPPPPPLQQMPLGPYGDVASSYYIVEDFLESIRNDGADPPRRPEEVFEIDLTNDESDD